MENIEEDGYVFVPPAPPVCRYFLAGGCYRSDCMFTHDATAITCRFWALGECIKGESCAFRHAFEDEESIAAHHSQKIPKLSSSTAPPPPPMVPLPASYQPPTDLPLSIADRLKLNQLFEKYGHGVSEQIIEPIFLYEARRNSSVTESILMQRFPSLKPMAVSQPSPSTSSAKSTAPVVRTKAQSVQWVETGDALAAHYSSLRDEAILHANSRNSLFDLAAQAYVAGQKDRANELSRLARQENEKMVALHAEAAECIFTARNKALGENVIDFHGLHVKEALPRLDDFLTRLASTSHREAYIIIGTGHHSAKYSGGKSRLLPAIQEHLRTNYGYHFEDSSTDKRGGALRVFLKSNR